MTPTERTIRAANPDDADAIFAVHRASVHALCASHYSPEHIQAWFQNRSSSIYQAAIEAGHLWVAEESGEIVGFASAEPGEVTLLFVAPASSGRGIGRRLLQDALRRAQGVESHGVEVVATLNSLSFYQRYGFESVERETFVRGVQPLHYPVVRMVQRTQGHGLPGAADA